MTYSNPLSTKLGLLDDDLKMEGKLLRLCADLEQQDPDARSPTSPWQWHVQRADVTAEAALKADDWRNWEQFGPHSVWAKKQGHTWFAAEVTVPEAAAGQDLRAQVHLAVAGPPRLHRPAMPRLSRRQDRPGARRQPHRTGDRAQRQAGQQAHAAGQRLHLLRSAAGRLHGRVLSCAANAPKSSTTTCRRRSTWRSASTRTIRAATPSSTSSNAPLRALDRRDGFTPEFEASLRRCRKDRRRNLRAGRYRSAAADHRGRAPPISMSAGSGASCIPATRPGAALPRCST